MSMPFTQRLVSIPAGQPRGAVRPPAMLAWLARTGRAVWLSLEEIGQARANSELERMARLHAHRPEFAAALRGAMRPDRRRG
jgi:hypothetical protein